VNTLRLRYIDRAEVVTQVWFLWLSAIQVAIILLEIVYSVSADVFHSYFQMNMK
jgi:hypothetical protein